MPGRGQGWGAEHAPLRLGIPTGRTKVVQAPALSPGESGLIKTIAVEEGQHVIQGQVLVELDATETGADRQMVEQQLMQTRLEIARLRAVLGLPGGELMDQPPQDSDGTGTDPLMLLLAQSLQRSQLAGHAERLASFDREIERQQAQARANQSDIAKYNEILPLQIERTMSKQQLLQKGLTPKMEMLAIQQQLIEMQRNRDAAQAHLAEAKSLIASIQRQKAQAEEKFKRDRLKELADAEHQATALDQQRRKAEERQRLKTITAPVSGTVQQLSLHTLGGMITPGQALMAIVPDVGPGGDSGIIDTVPGLDPGIEAMIQNQDIGFVTEGQQAVIRLSSPDNDPGIDAFPFTRYGTVPEMIKIVSEDAVSGSAAGAAPSEAHRAQAGEGSLGGGTGTLFYAARVTLDETTMECGWEERAANARNGGDGGDQDGKAEAD